MAISQNDLDNKLFYSCKNAPVIASIDVTTACNFRCLHCYNDSGEHASDELSDDEIIDVARQLAALSPQTVCLCGGEPLMRKNLFDIINTIRPHVGNLNMVSNGSLVTKDVVKELKAAGLSSLQISLDGINATQHDTFRGYSGAFEKATNAIKMAAEEGIHVATSFVPNKLNHNSIKEYIELCRRLGVNLARFMPLIPMGRGSRIDQLILSPEEYINLQLNIVSEQEHGDGALLIEWGDPLDHYLRMPANAKLGMYTYSLDVKANGNLAVSTYIPIVVGNVRKHSLQEYWDAGYNSIWMNPKVLEFISNIETVYDINQLEPRPYSGEYYYIDIL